MVLPSSEVKSPMKLAPEWSGSLLHSLPSLTLFPALLTALSSLNKGKKIKNKNNLLHYFVVIQCVLSTKNIHPLLSRFYKKCWKETKQAGLFSSWNFKTCCCYISHHTKLRKTCAHTTLSRDGTIEDVLPSSNSVHAQHMGLFKWLATA